MGKYTSSMKTNRWYACHSRFYRALNRVISRSIHNILNVKKINLPSMCERTRVAVKSSEINFVILDITGKKEEQFSLVAAAAALAENKKIK